jgi:hypothetical protein
MAKYTLAKTLLLAGTSLAAAKEENQKLRGAQGGVSAQDMFSALLYGIAWTHITYFFYITARPLQSSQPRRPSSHTSHQCMAP